MSGRPGTGPTSTIGLALGMNIASKRIVATETRAASLASPAKANRDRFSASNESTPAKASLRLSDGALSFGFAAAFGGSLSGVSPGLLANQPGLGGEPVRGCLSAQSPSAFKRPQATSSRRRRSRELSK